MVAAGALSANAADDTGSTDGHVEVSTAISLTGLTSAFTLSGAPGDTITGTGAVDFNVRTNNISGYTVTVQAATATLVAATSGNTDSIPIGALSVREGTNVFVPLSNTSSVTVHDQDTESAELGDALTNDYRVVIPFVNSDTYTVTINYIASTQ